MRDTRPKNLNLLTIRFPLPAIVSILHRISGVVLFLLIPVFLLLFDISLTWSGYELLQDWMSSIYIKTLAWFIFIPFCYHLVAGIRHLLSDINIGDSLKGGRIGSLLVFLITFILVILAGIWIW